jgi:hypothetical protein
MQKSFSREISGLDFQKSIIPTFGYAGWEGVIFSLAIPAFKTEGAAPGPGRGNP